jgi:hypothetical protein
MLQTYPIYAVHVGLDDLGSPAVCVRFHDTVAAAPWTRDRLITAIRPLLPPTGYHVTILGGEPLQWIDPTLLQTIAALFPQQVCVTVVTTGTYAIPREILDDLTAVRLRIAISGPLHDTAIACAHACVLPWPYPLGWDRARAAALGQLIIQHAALAVTQRRSRSPVCYLEPRSPARGLDGRIARLQWRQHCWEAAHETVALGAATPTCPWRLHLPSGLIYVTPDLCLPLTNQENR